MKQYIAIDQNRHMYGPFEHPRKEQCELLARDHVEKYWVDTIDGAKQRGYIIGGLWLGVYEIKPVDLNKTKEA
jgi:hypothetical protein